MPGMLNGQPSELPSPAASAKPGQRNTRRRLRNWRVRSRLLVLIVIPTASALALGSISITTSVRNALAYQRVETLARLGRHIVTLAQALEDERDQIVVYIAMGASAGGRDAYLGGHKSDAAPQLSVIAKEFGATNRSAAQVRGMARQIGSSYSAQARQSASVALTALSGLASLRTVATTTKLPALVVVQEYTGVIDDVLALNDQIAQAANDPALGQTVQVLSLVSAMQEVASQQRAILAAALWQKSFGPGQLAALEAAQSAQQSEQASFDIAASIGQQRLWNTSINKSFVYQANAEELQAISLQESRASLASDPISPADWYGAMSNAVDVQMGSVTRALTNVIIARAGVLRKGAILTALIIGVGVLVLLVLALILTMIVGRSMVRPLRRLRAGALDVAGIRLPETVRRMSEADSEVAPTDVEPIDVDSLDEIGEVARAFDQVHREALRLAANEAALRGNVNAMFVNLSRRSQSLVERQIKLIDELEQGEQDPERLGNLFQMDHLATRMRRNSENLLVLAGHESARRWNQPVPLVDVLRAAVSEIEQYERVTLNVQPGIAVRGPAVNDVVHLIAELAENATSFSSADTPVNVSGHLLNSGGVLLDISDLGVGMGGEEMAHANWRLDNPPVVDVAVSRRMGLFVVARLAARHGIRVRLRPASGVGLTALVWLPDEVVVREGAARSGGMGGSPEPLTRFAIGAGPVGIEGPGSRRGQRTRRSVLDQASGHLSPPRPPSRRWRQRGCPCSLRKTRTIRPGSARRAFLASARALVSSAPQGARSPSRLRPRRLATCSAPGRRLSARSTRPFRRRPPRTSGPSLVPQELASFQSSPRPHGATRPAEPAAAWGDQPAQPSAAWGDQPAEPAAAWGDQPAQPGPGTTGEHPAWGSSQPAAAWGGDQGTQPLAAWTGDKTEQPVLGAPITGLRASGSSFRSEDSHFGPTNGGVIIPPASSLGEENRLPIFEAVESDWFRRGRPSVDASGESDASADEGLDLSGRRGLESGRGGGGPQFRRHHGGRPAAAGTQGEPHSGHRCRNFDASARAFGGGDEGAVRQPAAWSARGACHGRRRER